MDESKLSKSVMEAVKYMRKHYSEPISLESVSAEVHLKTDYLSRIFKEETGMNYSAFLAEIRLKKAAYLLIIHQNGFRRLERQLAIQMSVIFLLLLKRGLD